ncbi:uncharacterized protein K452DRAFT_291519 [Aplosporella prunicola CBS 121167]|uniref:Uncharacterized protein n=1 Tax=Aplosporella prunicola CBS 121167 TaxID=1176127 RepID=A0A6A6B281_9PEZI|nr:uncharacterized protein K452DRAFT_291519 [Aplosporella prunicola CBS 121167]KAF2137473.1 hypothetical protein K452DRAFT_291519 [Aplosporella prunicola CBS 121167]
MHAYPSKHHELPPPSSFNQSLTQRTQYATPPAPSPPPPPLRTPHPLSRSFSTRPNGPLSADSLVSAPFEAQLLLVPPLPLLLPPLLLAAPIPNPA